ncbi:FixH family protein [Salinisphaera sp. C84B14]|uniref:FixH family protein n=1 Tax=Salinisphaera sp. C84B14 TaxID=1304155 RepID=UPI0033401B0A
MSMTQTTRPWYRHVWPWALMAPPAASVVFWVVIITTMAGPPDLVVEDYAKVGLAYTEDASARETAERLQISANAQVDRDTGRVSLRVDGFEDAPATLRLALVHATRASGDQTIELERNSAGIYHGSTAAAIVGDRELRLAPANGAWIVTGQLDADHASVRLAPHGGADSA